MTRFKIYKGFAFFALTGSLISSCFTLNHRDPSSTNTASDLQAILKDRFTQDGYDHATQRNFKGLVISNEQIVHELAGRTIWFKSAPNERHHTYVFPQRIGVAIDWAQTFLAINRPTRFQTWGLINDPDCCVPGVTCDQKNKLYNGRSVTSEDTYGWEYCAGDQELLNSLRQNRVGLFQDPACDDVVIKTADSFSNQIRENRCLLKFGTSAGAVGFRKFPNPRFNAERWEKIGGYKSYSEKMIREGINNSIQPPFRVATACAACHAGFDPLNTPSDVNNPNWENIKGEAGNQYINISKLMANGMKESTIETQLFTHTRPGTVDTSAVSHDFMNNPGTINAIINLPQRPLFKDIVARWDQVNNCDTQDTKNCQKIAYRDERGQLVGYKFWKWQKSEKDVPHLLKGGEDSVGYDLALQRVFINVGMCSEQCWQNNLTNLRELDITSRGYGEAVFNIGQCREQCSEFRANEDRISEVLSYLASRRPTDLKEALKKVKNSNGEAVISGSKNSAFTDAQFKNFLELKYGAGSIERGQNLFSNNCASCHSSQNNNSRQNLTPNQNLFQGIDFLANTQLKSGEIIRVDWLGNDKSTAVGEVGTYKCRALHTNHKRGNVWDQFASDTYKNLPAVTEDNFEKKIEGGPGYYRNISLLSVWASAPLMHNNAIGPEICGQVDNLRQVVRTSVEGRQMDSSGKYVCDSYFDPSVVGRLNLYDKSVDELLTPAKERRQKITRLDAAIKFPLGIKDMYLEFPAGISLNTIANFDLKTFIYDFTVSFALLDGKDEISFNKYWAQKFLNNSKNAAELSSAMKVLITSLQSVPGLFSLNQQIKNQNVESLKVFSKYYKTCDAGDDVENKGHEFGTMLSLQDKQSLKAFMATL